MSDRTAPAVLAGAVLVDLEFAGHERLPFVGCEEIPPSKVKALDINDPRPRFGNPNFPDRGDHWFVYGPRNYEPEGSKVLYRSHYVAIATEIVALLDGQGEPFWRSTSP